MHDSTCNGRALLLATAELMREVIAARSESKHVKRFTSALLSLIARHALQEQRKHHILQRRHGWQEIEKLENDSELMASITIEGILFGGVQCQIVDINFSRSRLIDARD